MQKLCLGSFFKAIKFTKLDSSHLIDLLYSVISCIYSDSRYHDSTKLNGLMNCKYELSEFVDLIKKLDKQKLISRIQKNVEPDFDNDGKRFLIVCIRELLKEDSEVSDTTNIGFDESGYTKQDFLNNNFFNFAETFANVLYYCIVLVKNTIYKSYVKEIDKEYFDKFKPYIKEIAIETPTTYMASTVSLSLSKYPFNSVFTKVADIKLSIPNANELKIYCLDVTNSKLDYKRLQDYITSNIGNYIFSRSMRNRYSVEPNSSTLGIKAINAYKKRVKSDLSTNHFNEIMLYSFLECVLGAPKIFSKMELQSQGEYVGASSGIHILSSKKGAIPFNQLVLGSTDSNCTLQCAIDRAFEQVMKIKDSSNEEIELVESSIYNSAFDADTLKALESIMLPVKGSGVEKPDISFGLFLGYTVDKINEEDNFKYKTRLKEKMKQDLIDASSYLENKINTCGLNNYSFYIYVLPLNDALIDRKEIMNNALGGDDYEA